MLVVIEGVDKAGKSTLAERLKRELGWNIVHFGKPGPKPANEYAEFLKYGENMICDRFYVGELVYGPLLRGKHSMTALEIITIERMCRKAGMILVHVDPEYGIIATRLMLLGDELINAEQNEKAYKMFKDVVPTRNTGQIVRWVQGTTVQHVTETIRMMVDRDILLYERAKESCSGIGTVIGEKLVFVGESLNDKTTWIGMPFDSGASAEYLLTAMASIAVDESKVYITNSDKITQKEVDFLKGTGSTKFISLGNKAYDKLKTLGISSAKIPHPGYWRRFHHYDLAKYSNQIAKAIYKEAYIYGTTWSNI